MDNTPGQRRSSSRSRVATPFYHKSPLFSGNLNRRGGHGSEMDAQQQGDVGIEFRNANVQDETPVGGPGDGGVLAVDQEEPENDRILIGVMVEGGDEGIEEADKVENHANNVPNEDQLGDHVPNDRQDELDFESEVQAPDFVADRDSWTMDVAAWIIIGCAANALIMVYGKVSLLPK